MRKRPLRAAHAGPASFFSSESGTKHIQRFYDALRRHLHGSVQNSRPALPANAHKKLPGLALADMRAAISHNPVKRLVAERGTDLPILQPADRQSAGEMGQRSFPAGRGSVCTTGISFLEVLQKGSFPPFC